ncbi:MAG: hypothetical protein M1812_008142 [Candelaria pacifica]|nr:MAG: hypothetical protein M1812_008142 [Candelaria pacifica]
MMSNPPLQAQQRPRSKSAFSFRSHKSGKSNASEQLADATENATHSQQKRLTVTKADPRLAMSEAEPAAIALGESNLQSIRSLQHRDSTGNVIADPDRSNPTRSRWERPLDTIRAFEAAIDGNSPRKGYGRGESTETANGGNSRRSSYYQGPGNNSNQRMPQDGGYYGGRAGPSRPDSFIDNYTSSNQSRGVRFGQRMNSEPALNSYNNSHGIYPSHGYQPSQDTVTTGVSNGSHGTDQWGNSTDPSSENSSIDRMHQVGKPDTGDNYGLNGFGGAPQFQGPILEEYGQGQPGYGYQAPVDNQAEAQGHQGGIGPLAASPQVPPKENEPRTVIKLGSLSGAVGSSNPQTMPSVDVGEKRKSWFKKRFSKG